VPTPIWDGTRLPSEGLHPQRILKLRHSAVFRVCRRPFRGSSSAEDTETPAIFDRASCSVAFRGSSSAEDTETTAMRLPTFDEAPSEGLHPQRILKRLGARCFGAGCGPFRGSSSAEDTETSNHSSGRMLPLGLQRVFIRRGY